MQITQNGNSRSTDGTTCENLGQHIVLASNLSDEFSRRSQRKHNCEMMCTPINAAWLPNLPMLRQVDLGRVGDGSARAIRIARLALVFRSAGLPQHNNVSSSMMWN